MSRLPPHGPGSEPLTLAEDGRLRGVGKALDALDRWESLTGTLSGAWKVAAGSDFEGDDLASHPYPVSGAAWSAITAAVSHLGCLRRSLFVHTTPDHVEATLDTHGQFTLIRGSLENASMAVWLMAPDERGERVLRRLQQDWAEVRQLEQSREILGAPSTRSMDERQAELSRLAEGAGADAHQVKKRPAYSAIVAEAGASVRDGKLALFVWKACSSLAHGEMRGMIAYLNATSLGQPTPGMNLGRITSNVELLAAGGLLAVRTVSAAFASYQARAGTTAGPDAGVGC